MGDVEHLIDFVLDRQTMAVPARATGDMMASLAGVAGDDILDGAREDVSVVW